MRVGTNPQKQEQKIILTTHHRIVAVVYIPNEEGFYKNSLPVFKMCLESLVTTINSKAAITIVNNGSYDKVSELLNTYLSEKKIDTVITHRNNIGKIDAQIGAARGAREPLVTLTDSDILFVKGWQEMVEEVFASFPNVGSVSPIPLRKGLYSYTSTVLKQIILKRLKFVLKAIPENLENYNRFLKSINWNIELDLTNKWPVVENNGVKAIVGSAHQVLTINRDILFTTSPSNPSLTLVGGNSENEYVDIPIDKAGKLRLATYHNYAFHMGNVLEDWMIEVQDCNFKENSIMEGVSCVPLVSDLFNSKFKNKIYSIRKKITRDVFKFLYSKGTYDYS